MVEAGESLSVVPVSEIYEERSAKGLGTGPVFGERAGAGERRAWLGIPK